MKPLGFLLAATVAFALPYDPGVPAPGSPAQTTTRNPAGNPDRPRLPEPVPAPLAVGDHAPDAAFRTQDGRTLRVSNLTAAGGVLLVFAPSDDELRRIESERDDLLDMGVIPAAVIQARDGAVWSRGRRLGLRFLLVPDDRAVLAGQFDRVDHGGGRTEPGWCVIDRDGTVRALGSSAHPAPGYARIAASALLIPSRDANLPAGSR